MDYIADHWQLVFGGIGTAVVAAIVGAWAKSHFDQKAASKAPTKVVPSQQIRSGSGSTNFQAGRDLNADAPKKK
jgi:hypothetical protein